MALSPKKLPLLTICTLLFGAVSTKCDHADIFKTIENFPNLTEYFSTTPTYGGYMRHCVTAELTHFDSEAGTAAYTLYPKHSGGDQATILHTITAGDSPHEVKIVSSPDPEKVWTATVPFTDQKTCFILKGQDIKNVCVLWVSSDSIDNVPKQCTQEYNNICGRGFLLHDKSRCGAESGHARKG
ncbi:uncharacterized protein LOC144152122 [Haemaphysalis longicornis]